MRRGDGVYLMPCCSKLHGELLQAAFDAGEHPVEVVGGSTASTVREGLRCVNNDACYETIASVGSLMAAHDELAAAGVATRGIVVPRLCADCRSMDTAAFAARSFRRGRGADVEVLDATDVLKRCGGVRLQQRIGLALWAGDIVVQGTALLRPGSSGEAAALADDLRAEWLCEAREVVRANDLGRFSRFCEQTTARAFEAADPASRTAPEVVLVGTAPVLYDDCMNAGAVRELEREGCRVSVPTLSGFVRWEVASVSDETELGLQLGKLGEVVRSLDLPLRPLPTRVRLRSSVAGVVPETLRYGDGWRIAAHIAHEAEHGVRNFVYVSTFGCLSGHVMGKGVLRWARGLAPDMHVSAIEYDPGTSSVNQSNRIKLVASIAKAAFDAAARRESGAMAAL